MGPRIAVGFKPGEVELADAPFLIDWAAEPLFNGLARLVGQVRGHLLIPEGWIATFPSSRHRCAGGVGADGEPVLSARSLARGARTMPRKSGMVLVGTRTYSDESAASPSSVAFALGGMRASAKVSASTVSPPTKMRPTMPIPKCGWHL